MLFTQYIVVECFVSLPILTSTSIRLNSSKENKSWSPKQQENNNNNNNNSNNNNGKEQEWQSGYIFSKNNSRPPGGKRRNDPWWMREEEKDNPRMFPQYRPWWLNNDKNYDDMKVVQLREEATIASLDSSGLKADLIQRLNESKKKFSLSDDCYTEPIYKKSDKSSLPSCYPDIYENENEIKRLRSNDQNIVPPGQ